MHLCFERLRGVVGEHCHFPLHYDRTCINLVGDDMHCSAALGLSGFDHSLVYVGAVHPFSAIGRKKRGMDIEDTPLVGIDDVFVQET